METLEIEVSYIQQLVDEEVALVVRQFLHWEQLEDCVSLFDLDASNIQYPALVLSELIPRKADEHLSEEDAKKFKTAWGQTPFNDKLYIAVSVFENA